MKLKVISSFRDKVTRKIILPGSTFETDDEERVNKLIDNKLAEEIEEKMTKDDIIAKLKELNIDHDPKVKKDELLALLGDQ